MANDLDPQILDDLTALTLEFRTQYGCEYLSARMIWEHYRATMTQKTRQGEYKLNNNQLPQYARAIMQHPGLEGVFRTRRMRTEPPPGAMEEYYASMIDSTPDEDFGGEL